MTVDRTFQFAVDDGPMREATVTIGVEVASRRACFFCGKALSAHAGFIETVHQPDGTRRDFCTPECLHWQLHEDEKADR